jgi:uncharacterized protein
LILKNETKQTVLADNCAKADSFFLRFKGLMLKKSLLQGSGLLITPCNSIHMFFMRFPIDAIFVDKNNKVVYLVEGLKPWKLSKLILKAHSVIELSEGTIKDSLTTIGDTLAFEE